MQHIGFIMDGNRSFAKSKGLPIFEGHRRGYENAKNILRTVKQHGIPFVSFWVLSDDNIRKRTPEEVSYLFDLLSHGILDLAKESDAENIRIVCIGDRTLLPKKCLMNIQKAEKMTENNTSMTAIIAVAYGGNDEILRAVRAFVDSGEDIGSLTREKLESFIESARYPAPDLIIRTGGHRRHSGFLLYQSAYAEYHFSEKNWPEFSELDLQNAIEQYKKQDRKFGK